MKLIQVLLAAIKLKLKQALTIKMRFQFLQEDIV